MGSGATYGLIATGVTGADALVRGCHLPLLFLLDGPSSGFRHSTRRRRRRGHQEGDQGPVAELRPQPAGCRPPPVRAEEVWWPWCPRALPEVVPLIVSSTWSLKACLLVHGLPRRRCAHGALCRISTRPQLRAHLFGVPRSPSAAWCWLLLPAVAFALPRGVLVFSHPVIRGVSAHTPPRLKLGVLPAPSRWKPAESAACVGFLHINSNAPNQVSSIQRDGE